ncbi:oxygen-dependent tRNA uridine(34) hydroxylase TrhO [Risungbinella massiliensis]|uniref:oxygen-dependent tRNA uridine(34) hydroxylase TrhO n=1 Tax=Risungbinella massiliensis TaxID=1329796 RepID=UPI0005CB9D99|nr:rhodanese-related sulfurtransferase [Risungbinella massiliensis]
MTANYQVLLYYQYTHIEDPKKLVVEQKELCQKLNLKGRILIAEEGLNGTVSGTMEETTRYMEEMHQHPLFENMPFKIDLHDGHAFKKLTVKQRPEIVAWHMNDQKVDPNQLTGVHLSPSQWYQAMTEEDVIVIDGRNDFEYDLGHFRGAIRPDVSTTREFPEWIRQHKEDWKDKKILTYCTGGIRCEKLSGVLLQEGLEKVYQLDGGIVTYGKDPNVQGALFDGQCYVFDDRISVPINQKEHVIVGKCHHCGSPAEKYLNCRYDPCDRRHLVCPDCESIHGGYCSNSCRSQDTTTSN